MKKLLLSLNLGKTCNVAVDLCNPNPCQNNGVCKVQSGGRQVCECTQSFSGPTCSKPRSSCGKYFRAPQGYIEFPVGTGNKYDHGLSCAWVIVTNHTLVLNVTFTKFALEGPNVNDECSNDYVQVTDFNKIVLSSNFSTSYNFGKKTLNILDSRWQISWKPNYWQVLWQQIAK